MGTTAVSQFGITVTDTALLPTVVCRCYCRLLVGVDKIVGVDEIVVLLHPTGVSFECNLTREVYTTLDGRALAAGILAPA